MGRGGDFPGPEAGTLSDTISVGGRYACGVTTDGHLSCWGEPDDLRNADDVPEAATEADI